MTATITKNMTTIMTAFFIACLIKKKIKQKFNLHYFFQKIDIFVYYLDY